jgi:secreted PhoX family phosphatase
LYGEIGSFNVVIDNLFGYPDNIKIAEDGQLWVAIPTLRDKVTTFMDNHPILRKALINARIP